MKIELLSGCDFKTFEMFSSELRGEIFAGNMRLCTFRDFGFLEGVESAMSQATKYSAFSTRFILKHETTIISLNQLVVTNSVECVSVQFGGRQLSKPNAHSLAAEWLFNGWGPVHDILLQDHDNVEKARQRIEEIVNASKDVLALLDKERALIGAGTEVSNNPNSLSPDSVQYVTLDQMAALVNRTKKTLERWMNGGHIPPPDVEGGGGKPHEWEWSKVRESLSRHSEKTMPERFPSLHQ